MNFILGLIIGLAIGAVFSSLLLKLFKIIWAKVDEKINKLSK